MIGKVVKKIYKTILGVTDFTDIEYNAKKFIHKSYKSNVDFYLTHKDFPHGLPQMGTITKKSHYWFRLSFFASKFGADIGIVYFDIRYKDAQETPLGYLFQFSSSTVIEIVER